MHSRNMKARTGKNARKKRPREHDEVAAPREGSIYCSNCGPDRVRSENSNTLCNAMQTLTSSFKAFECCFLDLYRLACHCKALQQSPKRCNSQHMTLQLCTDDVSHPSLLRAAHKERIQMSGCRDENSEVDKTTTGGCPGSPYTGTRSVLMQL